MATTPISRPMAPFNPTWVGVNFWSRVGGPFMWRSYNDVVVGEELAVLARHSLNVTRSFFFWPDFQPEPYTIDEEKCAAYRRFLDQHLEHGLTTIPTFIVGHMSGQNWDPSWRAGRDLYSDVWMVGRQAWFITEMVKRFSDHPAVSGWLISNEMPLYGGGGGLMGPAESVDAEVVRTWAELMVAAVAAGGGTQPVSLGDGAWGAEVMGADNGFRLSWTAPLVDWIGPHSYHMNDDQVRQNLIPAFNSELCALFDRPVILEEFGVTSSFASDENAAHYYRQVLYSSLVAGVVGWIGWNNTDFDLESMEPYDHRPFELTFGLTTVDGTPKQALEVLGEFAEVVQNLDLPSCSRADSSTAIVISDYFNVQRPFWSEDDSPAIRDSLLTSYIGSRLADLTPAFVRDNAEIPAAPLLLVPSAKAITSPGCRALETAAREGSTVWISYGAGETLNQRGWWWPNADTMFGIAIESRYGLVEPVNDDIVEFTFEADFGDIASGSSLRFPVGGSAIARSMLPVREDGATVVARDAQGRPAILVREVGQGRLVLCTYPLELFVARTPFVDHAPLVALMSALALVAGCPPQVTTDDPTTMVDRLVSADGNEHFVVLNTTDQPRRVSLRGSHATSVDLPAFGARVLTQDETTAL